MNISSLHWDIAFEAAAILIDGVGCADNIMRCQRLVYASFREPERWYLSSFACIMRPGTRYMLFRESINVFTGDFRPFVATYEDANHHNGRLWKLIAR